VHAGLEEPAGELVEALVGLPEGDARAAVAEIVEAVPTGGLGPQRLADRLVLRELAGLRDRDDLERSADATAAEVAGHAELAATHEALPVLVAGIDDLDAHVAVLDDQGLAVGRAGEARVQRAPDLIGGGVDLEGELVRLHGGILTPTSVAPTLAGVRALHLGRSQRRWGECRRRWRTCTGSMPRRSGATHGRACPAMPTRRM
jgi:hypothetical protein